MSTGHVLVPWRQQLVARPWVIVFLDLFIFRFKTWETLRKNDDDSHKNAPPVRFTNSGSNSQVAGRGLQVIVSPIQKVS